LKAKQSWQRKLIKTAKLERRRLIKLFSSFFATHGCIDEADVGVRLLVLIQHIHLKLFKRAKLSGEKKVNNTQTTNNQTEGFEMSLTVYYGAHFDW
jgi:hypothetical protein